ncbi:MAG TPA: hypothetical protein VD908_16620 [Cytophagales bacterium]|nr:hypothetical protein [Cytophagales bacterium]
MKITLPVLFIFFLPILILKAQVEVGGNIPTDVSQSFKATYENAKETKWQKEGDLYCVRFKVQNNQSVCVMYDECGKALEKYMALPSKDTPSFITDFIRKNYPQQRINNYWVKQEAGGRIYKMELASNLEGSGAIIGISNGGAEDSLSVSITQRDELEQISEILYFDQNGNTLTAIEAIEGRQFVSDGDTKKETITRATKNSKSRHARKSKRQKVARKSR